MDAMAEISGLDKEDVKAVAIAYASANNAMEFHGLGVTEHSQGTKTVMLISNLAMMTGNLGRPGVGVNPLRGQNNVQGAADMGCQPHHGPGYLWMDQKDVQDFMRISWVFQHQQLQEEKFLKCSMVQLTAHLKHFGFLLRMLFRLIQIPIMSLRQCRGLIYLLFKKYL